jgi:sphinganine-1-phosphate aldolase
MMAVYSYREWGLSVKGILHPEIIIPSTVHVSVLKACKYYGVEPKLVDIDKKTHQLKVSSILSKITRNTICIVLSAPTYSSGLMDPIEELSKKVVSYGVGIHVDACLGGFLIPFNEINKIPFGFDHWPGVTSIAIDFHKYGLSAKGKTIHNNPKNFFFKS